MSFKDELRVLINKYDKGRESWTPDFILAEYLEKCLQIFDYITQQKGEWYGKHFISGNEIKNHKHDWDTRYIDIRGVDCPSGIYCKKCEKIIEQYQLVEAIDTFLNNIDEKIL